MKATETAGRRRRGGTGVRTGVRPRARIGAGTAARASGTVVARGRRVDDSVAPLGPARRLGVPPCEEVGAGSGATSGSPVAGSIVDGGSPPTTLFVTESTPSRAVGHMATPARPIARSARWTGHLHRTTQIRAARGSPDRGPRDQPPTVTSRANVSASARLARSSMDMRSWSVGGTGYRKVAQRPTGRAHLRVTARRATRNTRG